MTVAFAALSLAGAVTGAAELALHGPAFFIFRANGAGASQTGPEEDQGPGQPNAPGAHHNAKVIPVKTKAKVIPVKSRCRRRPERQESELADNELPVAGAELYPIEGENGKWRTRK